MQIAEQVIFFNYKMMDSNGKLIESSRGNPLSIMSGKSQIFKPIENAVLKMNNGESKKVAVKSKEAFGEYDENLIFQVPHSKFNRIPQMGETFEMEAEDGSMVKLKMAQDKNGVCILDGNHSLAGVDLFFEIEVVKRRLATTQEIKTGRINSN